MRKLVSQRFATVVRAVALATLLVGARHWSDTMRAADRAFAPAPAVGQIFEPFKDRLKLRWDDQFLFVGSDGFPDHRMMVGITAWQQQVALPQSYFDRNAWQIPLKPVPAKEPLSAKSHFFRGAIALAANGVPIFNPIKND